MRIPFNKPHLFGEEHQYISDAIQRGHLSGNGFYTQSCQDSIKQYVGSPATFLTHSATHALEMISLISGMQPGDEVIVPDYTFVTTASAFSLRGIVPVFCDVNHTSLSIDPDNVKRLITKRTRAVCTVHYGGCGYKLLELRKLCDDFNILFIEDAAQALGGSYSGKRLGSIGDFSVFSFHETKNVSCGEGGILCVNNQSYIPRAQIVWEKGTNRHEFSLGLSSKYQWIEQGSSFTASELSASFLYAQLRYLDTIQNRRKVIWNTYHNEISKIILRNRLRWILPDYDRFQQSSFHLFYILLPSEESRNSFINFMNERAIACVFHYQPLSTSPAGRKLGKSPFINNNTLAIAQTLVRLPLFFDLSDSSVSYIVQSVADYAQSYGN
jgi:dTDP-4-amino-4,6-dideoxygalactose transaminase